MGERSAHGFTHPVRIANDNPLVPEARVSIFSRKSCQSFLTQASVNQIRTPEQPLADSPTSRRTYRLEYTRM